MFSTAKFLKATWNSSMTLCSCTLSVGTACDTPDLYLTFPFSNSLRTGQIENIQAGINLQMMLADPVNGKARVNALLGRMINMKSWAPLSASSQADFATLGRDVSMMLFGFNYLGSHQGINALGISLETLATALNSSHNSSSSSPYNYQQIMCRKVFSSAGLKKLSEDPPISTVQPYLQCRPTLTNAFTAAAGIAAANSALLASLFLGLSLLLIVQFVNTVHKDAKIIPPARKALLLSEADKIEKDELRQELHYVNAKLRKLAKVSSELDSLKAFVSQHLGPIPVDTPTHIQPRDRASFKRLSISKPKEFGLASVEGSINKPDFEASPALRGHPLQQPVIREHRDSLKRFSFSHPGDDRL